MIRVELFFGRTVPGGGIVSDADWSGFAARTLTPAFPDGFTVLKATGQWRDPSDGTVTLEPTTVVLVAGRISPAQVDRVKSAYGARFRQRSVGVLSSRACGVF